MRRGEVIEYEGIVVEANDDGTLDLLVPEYSGDESTVIEAIRGIFPVGGPYTLPIPGQVVVVEQRYPSRDPRQALRWVGHELELPEWLDTDRTGIRSRTGRMAIIFDEDLAGDGTGVGALLLGGLKADQKAVLGDVLVMKLGALIDQLVATLDKVALALDQVGAGLDVIAAAKYGAPATQGPMDPGDVQSLTGLGGPKDALVGPTGVKVQLVGPAGVKAELVGVDGQGGLKAALGEVLSEFVRVAKIAPDAEEGAGRTVEVVE